MSFDKSKYPLKEYRKKAQKANQQANQPAPRAKNGIPASRINITEKHILLILRLRAIG